jgi:hypothetical protein
MTHTTQAAERTPDARVIRVRDVARAGVYDLGPQEPILRGPYELFQPFGAVRRRGSLVDWAEGTTIRSARAAPAMLAEAHPGERVLVRLPPLDRADEWWLCEVEAVDGVRGST